MDFAYPGDNQIVVKDAEILGFGSSRTPGKDRWSEVTIVGTERSYFVAVVGKSCAPGEVDFNTGLLFRTARDLVRGLVRRPETPGAQPYMPRYSREALDSAAELDQDVFEALKSYDAASQWSAA
jgi:hypothetical protein